jgi:hypothetical protein
MLSDGDYIGRGQQRLFDATNSKNGVAGKPPPWP